MTGAELRDQIGKVWTRCGALLSEALTLSGEAGFYPDPLHLGPAFAILYSSEAQPEPGQPDASADEPDATS